jgi:hypothetical protein
MILQYVLIGLLLVLALLCRLFYKNKMMFQQRLLSIFLIVWAILSIVYYDVWNYVTVDNPHFGMWYTYIPPVCYSIGAGIGTYFLLKSFKKLNRVTITKAEDKKTKKIVYKK